MRSLLGVGNWLNWFIFTSLLFEFSVQYHRYNIEDDDLCSAIKKRKIKISERGPDSGLLVHQTRLSDHPIAWKSSFRCKFQVSVPYQRTGIAAVIQHIILRRNETSGECLDYIQFARKDGSTSQRFCGELTAVATMDTMFFDYKYVVPSRNTFVDDKGEMDVMIFVSKEPLKNDERMEISIAFTAFKHCNDVPQKTEWYKPCSEEHTDFCIFPGFFDDKIVNCPLRDCVDEGDCGKWIPKKTPESNSDKILLGALTSICLTFGLFIVCVWVSKSYKIFCWAPCCTNASSTPPPEQPTQSRVIEMTDQDTTTRPSQSQGNTSASAPVLEEDKDLPPSYDSLFPTR